MSRTSYKISGLPVQVQSNGCCLLPIALTDMAVDHREQYQSLESRIQGDYGGDKSFSLNLHSIAKLPVTAGGRWGLRVRLVGDQNF